MRGEPNPGIVLSLSLPSNSPDISPRPRSGRLNHFLDQLARADLIIVDALGYLSLTKQTARLFFQLVSKRYEKGSIIITSNKPFEQRGEIFADEVVAAAILDRLLQHSYPFIINGKSYRMKNIAKISHLWVGNFPPEYWAIFKRNEQGGCC